MCVVEEELEREKCMVKRENTCESSKDRLTNQLPRRLQLPIEENLGFSYAYN